MGTYIHALAHCAGRGVQAVKWIDERYNHPVIYVTENGCAFPDRVENGEINDSRRVEYLQGYVHNIHKAMQDGVDCRGYFVWSLLDNFEWALGYQMQFGICHVEPDSLKRTPKESARWYRELVKKNGF